MTSRRLGTAFVVLGSVLVLGVLAAGCGPRLETLPEPPNLATADSGVREQYEALRRQLEASSTAGDETRAEAYGRLGMWFHVYRLPEGAEVAYNNALELVPGAPRWAYLRGVLFSQQGRLEEAAEDLAVAAAAAAGATSRAASTRRAEAELELGRVEEAVALLESLVEADRDNVRALVALARGRAAQGREEDAAALLEDALAHQADASGVRYQLGTLYRRLGEETRAEAHLALTEPSEEPDRLRMADPWIRQLRDVDVSYLGILQQAREQAASGRHGEALRLFRAAREADPSRFAAAFGEARALYSLGRDAAALEACRRLVASFPDQASAHVLQGRLERRLADPGAEASFRRALELDPESLPALRQLAALAHARGELESAIRFLERARELAPSVAGLARTQAEILVEAGRVEEAKAVLREALPLVDEPWSLRLVLDRLERP